MLVREYYMTRKDGVKLYKTYSDKGNYNLQKPTSIEYDVAIDIENAPYTYEETDKPLETENI